MRKHAERRARATCVLDYARPDVGLPGGHATTGPRSPRRQRHGFGLVGLRERADRGSAAASTVEPPGGGVDRCGVEVPG